MTLGTNLDELKAYLARLIDVLDSSKWRRIQQIVITAGIDRQRQSPP